MRRGGEALHERGRRDGSSHRLEKLLRSHAELVEGKLRRVDVKHRDVAAQDEFERANSKLFLQTL